MKNKLYLLKYNLFSYCGNVAGMVEYLSYKHKCLRLKNKETMMKIHILVYLFVVQTDKG